MDGNFDLLLTKESITKGMGCHSMIGITMHIWNSILPDCLRVILTCWPQRIKAECRKCWWKFPPGRKYGQFLGHGDDWQPQPVAWALVPVIIRKYILLTMWMSLEENTSRIHLTHEKATDTILHLCEFLNIIFVQAVLGPLTRKL